MTVYAIVNSKKDPARCWGGIPLLKMGEAEARAQLAQWDKWEPKFSPHKVAVCTLEIMEIL